VIILLETGLRVSELCGLTLDDVDFENRKIKVERQLCHYDGAKTMESPKSKAGYRSIPMTDNVFESLQSVVKNRPVLDTEPVVDGVSGFVFLTVRKVPFFRNTIEQIFRILMKLYREEYPESAMPSVTPHVLRHTFCTNLIKAGLDVKSVQYLMGHSDAQTTLNVYTHTNYESVAEKMRKIDFNKRNNIINIAELAQQTAVKQG
jgi:integrase